MITSWTGTDGSTVRIQLRGNFSLGADGLVWLVLALAAVTLLLAGLLAWQGYWPVLIIALVQVVLVSWLLVRTWERSWLVETIEIGPRRIFIAQRRYKRIRQTELDTAWAVVEVERPKVAWYDPRVRLRSKDRSIEVGRFLTGEEKHQLVTQLKSALKNYSAL